MELTPQNLDLLALWGNGTSQSTREIPELDPSYAPINNLGLKEELTLAAKIADIIRFIDEQDQDAGSWAQFFTHDITVSLAVLLSVDLQSIKDNFQENLLEFDTLFQPDTDKYRFGVKFQRFFTCAELILDLIKQVASWEDWVEAYILRGSEWEAQVAHEIQSCIQQKIIPITQKLLSFDQQAAQNKFLQASLGLEWGNIVSKWKLEAASAQNSFEGANLDEQLNSASLRLNSIFIDLWEDVENLRSNLSIYFKLSITEKHDHHPQIGLLITFLKLLQHPKQELNQFAKNHLLHFFRHKLKQANKPPQADQAYVLCKLAKHVPEFVLPAHTTMEAGKDNKGKPILFESLEDQFVSRAMIGEEGIKTLFLQHNTKAFNTDLQSDLVSNIFAAPIANSMDGQGADREAVSLWPLFGEDQSKNNLSNMTQAEMGFAIASPVLAMEEGVRKIEITIQFEKDSCVLFEEYITDFKRSFDSEVSEEEVFKEILGSYRNYAFHAFFSGSEGWELIRESEIQLERDPSNNLPILRFSLRLTSKDSSVVDYDPRKFTDLALNTRFPVIKFILNTARQPNIYSILKELEPRKIDIQVEVQGLRRMSLFNELGRLDPAQPFQPFGAMPKRGAALLIGNAECFRKQLTAVKIDIDWHNLPDTGSYEGFLNYYAGYDDGYLDFNPNLFKVRLSALSGNQFMPEQRNAGLKPLFGDGKELSRGDSLDLTQIFVNDMDAYQLKPDPKLRAIDFYTTDSTIGFFKVELMEPRAAFGHHDYQRVFTKAAIEQARNPNQNQDNFVNTPYTPLIKSISLSYQAQASLQFDTQAGRDAAEQFFHIHPFGNTKEYPTSSFKNIQKGTCLFPQYDDNGYLFLGFQQVKAHQELAIFFQLSPKENWGDSNHSLPKISWHYLHRNQWHTFKEEHILLDTTLTFTQSGLIKLKLPAQIDLRNRLLPQGKFWIRVAVKGDTRLLCHAREITTQAVLVHRKLDSNMPADPMQVPAFSINKLTRKLPQIKEIQQPFPSFGGRTAETDNAFLHRVSERLRHKGRAMTHWDYERLVLENFPEIFQVKALSNANDHDIADQQISKGEVTIVVIPYKNKAFPDQNPILSYHQLEKIKRFLMAHTSPFIKIKVRNAEYEYLRILCDIKFVEGKEAGACLKQIRYDLNQWLSPWKFDDYSDFHIGGSIEKAQILNFLKGRSYVKLVNQFQIIHLFKEGEEFKYLSTDIGTTNVQITPKAWGVLIADEDHEFTLTQEEKRRQKRSQNPLRKAVRFQSRVDIFPSKEKKRHTKKLRVSSNDPIEREPSKDNTKTYWLKINL